jgi:hypothetical protein
VSAPILLGWRRCGGALVVGTSEEVTTPELLLGARRFAESTVGWTEDRWDSAFRAFWGGADPSLRSALAQRLPLPQDDRWSLESWSAAVWGTFVGAVSPPAVAVVGSSISDDVLEAIASLERRTRVAAFRVELLGESGERIRCSLVAGVIDPAPERALPGEIEDLAHAASKAESGRDPGALLAAVERLASESGAGTTWSRRDWVRFEGSHGAIRVFPRKDGVWIQLVGADEGTLAGLWFRHGLAPDLKVGDRPGAPPGAHFLLSDEAALTPPVEALLLRWLRGGTPDR